MKKRFAALGALFLLASTTLSAQTLVANFDNIAFWTGNGSNRAALVLDFEVGGSRLSVAWGYRWDGPAVMQDMLFALAGSIAGSAEAPPPLSGSDARLAVDVGYFAGYGFYVNSVTFDARRLGGTWPSAQLRIEDDYLGAGTYPAIYWRAGNGTWTSQPFGFSADDGIPTLALQNGGWFGIVQSEGQENFSFSAPYAAPADAPAPVPVPNTTIQHDGSGTSVSFVSTIGYYYQLQANTVPAATGWTNIGPASAGHGQKLTLSDPGASSFAHRFYRVLISR